MSSSQRAESQHSFFKNYVSQSNSLVEFMVQFKRGLFHQRNHELEEDYFNIEEKAKTVMSLEIEDHMAKVYTRKLFYEVQEQLTECFKLIRENETHCVCRKWESEGLPCRHVLSYLIKIQDVDKLPIQYILKRWTKEARQSLVLDSDGVEIKDNKALLARRTKLLQHATDAVDKTIISDDASQLLIDSLDVFLKNVKSLNVGNESGLSAIAWRPRLLLFNMFLMNQIKLEQKGVGEG
ncbi:hypothetical protein ACLB2K_015528 [Fragaria x ananassa]